MDMPLQDSDRKLTSERFDELVEALDVLYIKDNISGRNKFTLAWPEMALHVFGEELCCFDREGTTDRARRSVLEAEAEERRLAMLELLGSLEARSVDKGALQAEYVQGLVNRFGRKMSLDIYSRWLVDRFIPPLPEEIQPVVEETKPEPAAPAPPSSSQQGHGQGSMDHIRPISVEQEMSPPSGPEPELIVETQGGSETHLSAQGHESLAPVLGGQKKSGLRIMSIAENAAVPDPEKDKDNQ